MPLKSETAFSSKIRLSKTRLEYYNTRMYNVDTMLEKTVSEDLTLGCYCMNTFTTVIVHLKSYLCSMLKTTQQDDD